MTSYKLRQASELNILYDVRTDKSRYCFCRVYIDDLKRIPAHLRPYFHESIVQKLLRRLVGLAAFLFFFSANPTWCSRECRFPVNKISDDEFLFSWQIEDIFLLLKECGFHLFAQENGGAFRTPYGVFQELVCLDRIEQF